MGCSGFLKKHAAVFLLFISYVIYLIKVTAWAKGLPYKKTEVYAMASGRKVRILRYDN